MRRADSAAEVWYLLVCSILALVWFFMRVVCAAKESPCILMQIGGEKRKFVLIYKNTCTARLPRRKGRHYEPH